MKRKARKRPARARRSKRRKKKNEVYEVDPHVIEHIEKIKAKRNENRERTGRIVTLAILLIALLILMYIGASIKGKFTSSKCVDTDNGINEYFPGVVSSIVNGKFIKYEDKCIDPFHLREFYCGNGDDVKSEIINCKNGCRDGMCIS